MHPEIDDKNASGPWWWVNEFASVELPKEERKAAVALYFALLGIFIGLSLSEALIFAYLGFDFDMAVLLVTVLGLVPALYLAAPLVERLRPDLLQRADQSRMKRLIGHGILLDRASPISIPSELGL